MLGSDDLAGMAADMADLIGDNGQSIVIRRGDTELPAQTVRVEATSRGRLIPGDGSEETRANIVVLGSTSFDVQKDDRFTLDGRLYRVAFIRPNTQIAVQAEAEIVE